MTRETERQKNRLLNVAKALRESANPEAFTMEAYGYDDSGQIEIFGDNYKTKYASCGTPACALGHYASRTDLQHTFKLKMDGEIYGIDGTHLWYDQAVLDHFGIDSNESELLFAVDGCGNAKTNIQAAKFIEKFVKNKFKAD